MPTFTIVGLADKAVAASRERIRACLHGLGMDIPAVRLTVNLTPADFQKDGTHYDLPINMAIFGGMKIIPKEELANYMTLGDITLDGSILSEPGVLPSALLSAEHGKGIICPKDFWPQAALGGDIPLLAPRDILEIIHHFSNEIFDKPA